jgi:hypothetical protein
METIKDAFLACALGALKSEFGSDV